MCVYACVSLFTYYNKAIYTIDNYDILKINISSSIIIALWSKNFMINKNVKIDFFLKPKY